MADLHKGIMGIKALKHGFLLYMIMMVYGDERFRTILSFDTGVDLWEQE